MRLDGTRGKFGAPMFKPDVFRKEISCTEESTCEIVGTFRRSQQTFGTPIMIRHPGNCVPIVTPLVIRDVCYSTFSP